MTNGQAILLSYAIIAVGLGAAFLTPLGLGGALGAALGAVLRAYLLGHEHGWYAFAAELDVDVERPRS